MKKNRNIVVLGSTGSIGRNTLEVIKANPGRFNLVGICAGDNIELLKQQIEEFSPAYVCIKNRDNLSGLEKENPGQIFYHGTAGLVEIMKNGGIDTVVSAISGTPALRATLEAIRRGYRICLANKETLVAAGEIINRELEQSEAEIIPVDSEQSAIFQALGNNGGRYLKRIILTASGGPFYKRELKDFSNLTVSEALKHPTWNMGAKITIDSATLMNKALEMIEAYHLFKLTGDQIEIVIHPQSIVHSMVEFVDNSIIGQMSLPDMRLPILYSLTYPERIKAGYKTIDFAGRFSLDFLPVDEDKFRSIRMARYVIREGKSAGIVFNAANEVAVEYFLRQQINFMDIFRVVEEMLYNENLYPVPSINDIEQLIGQVKEKTANKIKQGFLK